MTTRSGRMKSSTAAPSFRNSGFDTTANRVSTPRAGSSSAIASRTRSAVPTGTVDLSTTILYSVIRRADVARGGEHVLHVGGAVLVGRRADGDELERAMRNRRVDVGGEVQPPGGDVARDHRLEAGLVDRHAALIQDLDLARVDVEAQHVVADLGETGAGDEPDVAGPDHRDFHASTPSEALMAASAATGSGACVIGRPMTR